MVPNIQIAFGQIRHRRLFPRAHEFAYRAFYLRVPITADLQRKAGNFLFGINRKSLLSFQTKDHGDGNRPLDEWIKQLLANEGIQADGPVWLHCFSRMFGYQFKPVSFWFCHKADHRLAAIVAEVNNTFGEKHLYLLSNPDQDMDWGKELQADKSFHVSPFFKIEGGYRFRFLNQAKRSVARVDYWVNDRLYLHTSMSGEHQALTRSSACRALLFYPLFSLGVIAKIHWHALRLWVEKRIPFIPKPNPPANMITKGKP